VPPSTGPGISVKFPKAVALSEDYQGEPYGETCNLAEDLLVEILFHEALAE
jgi:hypothetical protein